MKCTPGREAYGRTMCSDCPNTWETGKPIPECQFGTGITKEHVKEAKMENQETDEELKIESKESIKVIKNSKGWNFEVKIVDKENIEPQMDRLDRILHRLQEKYPNDK